MKKRICYLFILSVLACAPGPELIRDVQTWPQRTSAFVNPAESGLSLVSPACQESLNQRYDLQYFLPWISRRDSIRLKIVSRTFDDYQNDPGWGENLVKRHADWIRRLRDEAGLKSFPNVGRPGITTANSNLRGLPTDKPIFRNPQKAGEGFPFDYLQTSSIPANTPVRILHATRDKSWLWVESHIAAGWLPSRDAAFVDTAFIERWKSSDKVVVIRDEISVCDTTGHFLFHAPLGSIFPRTGADSIRFLILAAVSDVDGNATVVEAVIPRDAAADKPLPLTTRNLANLADQFVNEPYGWGGMYRNRDCSAMLKDLFAPFGLMLPRHSAHQIKNGFDYFDLSGLPPPQKEKTIIQNGIPFLTLLWLPGHVMLYIGHDYDRALVFQNLWGLRTKGFLGKEGRRIVGQAVITTLSPGKEIWNIDPKGDLLSRIQGMAFVAPRDSILAGREEP